MIEQATQPPVPLADGIDRLIQRIGLSIGWVYVLLVLVIMLQVILRKGFSSGLIALEELQWHLYAIGVMFGLSYAQTTNSHIRVDLFYSHFRARTKYIVEILGILFLVLPFISIVFLHSLDFVADAWRINEHSDAPSGLPWRWAIKAVIPITFGLLALAMMSRLIRDTTLLLRGDKLRGDKTGTGPQAETHQAEECPQNSNQQGNSQPGNDQQGSSQKGNGQQGESHGD